MSVFTDPTEARQFARLVAEEMIALQAEPEYIYFSEAAEKLSISANTVGRKVKDAGLKTKYGTKGKMIRSKDLNKIR